MIASIEAFDALADAHDEVRWGPDQAPFDAMVWSALAGLAEQDQAAAVFLGCGSAREALPYVRAGHDVTLVDYSPRMLQLARERYRGCSNVSYLLQPVEEFLKSPSTQRYGHVSCVGEVLCYLEDPLLAMRRIREVLMPGGCFVFTWVDCHALRTAAHADATTLHPGAGVVVVVERDDPPLTISTWSQSHTQHLIVAAGYTLRKALYAPDTPRRCWFADRSAPTA